MTHAIKKLGLFAGLLACALWLPEAARAEKTVLRLRLSGPIMESPSDAAGLFAILKQERFTTLHDWVTTVRKAATDPKINGLILIIEQPQYSFAQLEEMTRAIDAFQARGKPVYCYMDYADNLSYALAATTDHITLAEHSELMIVGLHAEAVFLKRLLDKVGVEAEMLHCGAYKSALEPFTRTEPSTEAAENINWLLDGIFQRWIALMTQGRGLDADQVRQLVDRAPLSAAEAMKNGLVDEVSSFSAFKQRIRKEFGPDVRILTSYKDDAGLSIDFENPMALFQLISRLMEKPTVKVKPGVGLIYIDGAIVTGPSEDDVLLGSTAGSTSIRAAFETARQAQHVKAVVVRVNSPGGSALASDIIWQAASRCAAEKPVVVSMGGVAGSGGYYVAIPGDVIFAEASTITGSIGVVGGKLVWRELMEDKLGITTTEFDRGAHAGLMSANRKWNDSERAWIESYMNSVYDQFKGRVMASRGQRLKKDLEDIAGGRVYTGQQALELGLVDRIGGLSDALAYAIEKAGLEPDCTVHVIPKPSDLQDLLAMFEKLIGQEKSDEFEIGIATSLQRDPLIGAIRPLWQKLAPGQLGEVLRGVRNLSLIQREHVGCFMPLMPPIR